jgi:hypothetical protein
LMRFQNVVRTADQDAAVDILSRCGMMSS